MDNPQKSLESARQRFSQLVAALTAFNNVLRHGPPDVLPPWPTLQSQFNVISASLASVSNALTAHFPPPTETPSALVSYPLPSFPAQTQSILLSMLCNKKPHPATQDWFLRGLASPPVDATAQDELWRAVQDVVSDLQDARNWYDELYTAEERESGLETGLVLDAGGRRPEEKVPGLRLEAMLRFEETGVMPRDQPPLPTGGVGVGMKR